MQLYVLDEPVTPPLQIQLVSFGGKTCQFLPMGNVTLLTDSSTSTRKSKTLRGTYFVQTWGCQMNEEDSEQMALYLEQMGFKLAQDWRSAQIVILNTCSVRKKPEDKALSFLGELVPFKQARPDMIIGVAGCMAQVRADDIRRRNPHVDFIIGTAQVSKIPGIVEETLQTKRFRKSLDLPERKGNVVTDIPQRNLERSGKVKAHVPIQYGCDKFCTFCIVPNTRGRERSRPTEHIIEEVRRLAELGTKEVTLLGQTVNSYGKNLAEGRVPFSKLLQLLNGIPGLERIRYTSPYPRDFKTDLIQVIKDTPKVMEHCHMPLQGGHNDLLKRMNRLYTVESFRNIVLELRSTMPNIGLTTDIIVGFPGETEDEFEGTLACIKEFQFDGAYMFRYSPRPGTPAADMPQVPEQVSQDRLAKLMDLQNKITVEKNQLLIGNTFEVMSEGPSHKNPDMLQGFTRCFRMVHFPANPSIAKGDIVNVTCTTAHRWGLTAKIE